MRRHCLLLRAHRGDCRNESLVWGLVVNPLTRIGSRKTLAFSLGVAVFDTAFRAVFSAAPSTLWRGHAPYPLRREVGTQDVACHFVRLAMPDRAVLEEDRDGNLGSTTGGEPYEPAGRGCFGCRS